MKYRVQHRNRRLLELFFSGTTGVGVRECLHKGGGHLEDVAFKK